MWKRGELSGGGKVYVKLDYTITSGSAQSVPCPFQPDYVIVTTSDFIYTYDKDESASNTFIGQNLAWASSGRKGGYYANSIVPTSSGFTFAPISSTEQGKTAKIMAAKLG